MKPKTWIWRGMLAGVLMFLAIAPTGSSAGSLIDGRITVSAGSEQEVNPALAYNSQRGEYLAVWWNDRAGCDDIRAQRISKNGGLLGGPFYISAGCDIERRYPDVAYNSASDQYLVVWEQSSPSTYPTIQGRRVSGTGALLDSSDVLISSSGSNLYSPAEPAVAYASTSDRYLVVWSETWHPLPISYDIYGQVVTGAGAKEGGKFSITQHGEPVEEPDLAYNRHANRYLVAWQEKAGIHWDVFGQQVHGGGGLFGTKITIGYYTAPDVYPAVAAIPTTPTNEKFLVVWEQQYASNDGDIIGRTVLEDGTPGTAFDISRSYDDETKPAVVGDELSQRYFLVWRHPHSALDNPIKGRAVSFQGALVGEVAEFPGPAASHPAAAAGPNGDVLVAWQDQPIGDTSTNIYGQLWGNRVYLPILRK